ncbi:MAG: tungsten ABC transporter substrate-binding protein, partial [Janthinobacterium lividum]
IAVNPTTYPSTNYTDATKLIEWITSPSGQQAIADFKVNGEQVFFPSYGKAVASGK